MEIQDVFSIVLIFDGRQVERGIQLIFIVNCSDKIFFHLLDAVGLNAKNLTVIVYTKEYVTTITVGKGTNAVVDILGNVSSGFFKFHHLVFALFNKG